MRGFNYKKKCLEMKISGILIRGFQLNTPFFTHLIFAHLRVAYLDLVFVQFLQLIQLTNFLKVFFINGSFCMADWSLKTLTILDVRHTNQIVHNVEP